MKRTKQSTFAKRERSEKSTGFAPVGSEAMIHKHTYSIPSADDQNDARCIECGQLQPTTPHATHTPGPWTARKAPERNAYAWDVEGAQGTVPTIARMALVDRVSEVEANAHLIAAAPAMYEALQAIEARLQGVFDSPALMRQGMLTHDKSADVIRFVRDALARADGKQ